jgi:ubiquitin carboxyl-terminal hydrolase 36/42
MLASPLQPVVPFGKPQSENATYRPTKDCEAFRALVPPVEFIEGSSTGAVAILDSKYVPINGTPKVRVAHSISMLMLM